MKGPWSEPIVIQPAELMPRAVVDFACGILIGVKVLDFELNRKAWFFLKFESVQYPTTMR